MKTKRLLGFLMGVLGFSSVMVSCNKDDDIKPMYGVVPAEYKAKPDILGVEPMAENQSAEETVEGK